MKPTTKLALTAALALAITFTFTACEKKEAKTAIPEVAEAAEQPPAKAPAESKRSSNAKLPESITCDDCNRIKQFEYDEQSRIVKIYEYELVTIYEHKEGKLDKTITITYISDDKVKVTVTGSSNYSTDYVIKGNTIDNKYIINKDGFIVEDGYSEYGYKDGNLIYIDKILEEGTSAGYEYDNKKSPFSGSNTPKWLFFQLFDYDYFGKAYYTSKNNVIEYRSDECGGSTIKCEYEYDKDGFPTKQTCKKSVEGCEYEGEAYKETISTTYFTYLGGN